MASQPALEKADTLAARLGLSPRTLRRWAAQGKIASHRLSARALRFDEDEVRRDLGIIADEGDDRE